MQTSNSLSITLRSPDGKSLACAVYPTDGTTLTSRSGRHTILRKGRWKENKLILEETGPGNAPWHRSTDVRTMWLSVDGELMITEFHNVSDRDRRHDFTVTSRRIRPLPSGH